MIKKVDNLFLFIKTTILVYYLKSNLILLLTSFYMFFQKFKHLPVRIPYKEHTEYLIL